MNQFLGSLAGRVCDKLMVGKLPGTGSPDDMKSALQTLGRQALRQTLKQYEESLKETAPVGAAAR